MTRALVFTCCLQWDVLVRTAPHQPAFLASGWLIGKAQVQTIKTKCNVDISFRHNIPPPFHKPLLSFSNPRWKPHEIIDWAMITVATEGSERHAVV
ncbi:hypothetical protein GGR57DRAFT_466794 [Xylariaceae sp. FL1272]|nr:hypothetical protein GGR57DRAFT_466794 [Xylariaceae sp. FL1272]